MAWTVILLEEVEAWFLAMVDDDPESAVLVTAALDLLEEVGPMLGRPAVDRIKGSKLHNLKELRPGPSGRSEIRMLFVFDPDRQAVVLTRMGQGRQLKSVARRAHAAGRGPLPQVADRVSTERRSKTMARAWREVREEAGGRLDEQAVVNERSLLSEAVRAHRLAQLRKEQSLTQADVAGMMRVSQARVSKIEHGQLASTEMGTLRSYIEALGGKLRVVADFGDKSVTVE